MILWTGTQKTQCGKEIGLTDALQPHQKSVNGEKN